MMKLTPRQIDQLNTAHKIFNETEANADLVYQRKIQQAMVTGAEVQRTFNVTPQVKHRIQRNINQLKPHMETLNQTKINLALECGFKKTENGAQAYDDEQYEKAIKEAKTDKEKKKAEQQLKEADEAAKPIIEAFDKAWNAFLDKEEESEDIDLRKVPLSGFEGDKELPSSFYHYYDILIED